TRALLDPAAGKIDGDVIVTAMNDTTLTVVAGSGSYGSRAGFGAAVSYNDISNTISAEIIGATGFMHDGAISVTATDNSDLVSVTGSLGVSSEGAAAAGTVSINQTRSSVDARVTNWIHPLSSTDSVMVRAVADSDIFSFAGGFAGGKSGGLGVALAWNDISNQVNATITGSDLQGVGPVSVTA
ncbi:MAG: hypothetical protein GY778_24585, partial [bacterium]|nr:hypothetical protein [bacterium]